MKRRVIVVGGGASGLTAAIAAARKGADVTVLEHMARPGKKILVTGNGKCNLTNAVIPAGAYRGEHPDFAGRILERVDLKETLSFFHGIGIATINRNGYIYPASGQASSILDALRFELAHLCVPVVCDCQVEQIARDLTVVSSLKEWKADAVILAAGSKASPKTGSDGSGYRLAKHLGHRIVKPLPALVPLQCREKFYRQLAGVRAEAKLALFIDGRAVASDQGEVQFTDYGISGIPVFQVSRYAARALDEKKIVTARLDLAPRTEAKELVSCFKVRRKQIGYRPVEEFLNGMINKKLADILIKEAGLVKKEKNSGPDRRLSGELSDLECKRLAFKIKEFDTDITATNLFNQAQVCCGGVDTSQINPITMESRLVKNLYLTGEILDVDGICGGYNLQWAWSTGILAGRCAAR